VNVDEKKEETTKEQPVPQEVIDRLDELDRVRSRLGQQLLDLENERISILATSRKLDEERGKIFQALLVERGLSPDTPVRIDPKTRVLSVIK
jgi:lipase chaperone LimK